MKIFKTILCSILISFSLAMSSGFAAEPLNKVVAIVNDEVITQDDLNQAIKGVQERMAQAHVQVLPAAALRKKILDQLIAQKLELQLAKRAEIKVTDADLNATIARIAQSNHLTLTQLKQKIQSSGGNYKDFVENIRQQLILASLQRQVVAQQIKVTDAEADAAIAEIKKQMNASQQFQLLDVLIPTGSSSNVADIKRELQKNVSTATLSKQFPMATFNDMGWQNPNTLPELFLSALKSARANSVVGPIKAPNGLHLLKVIATKSSGPSQKITRDQAKMYVMQKKSQAVLQKWIEKMRKSAYVKIVN